MLKRGVLAALSMVRNESKFTPIVFLLRLEQFVSTPLSLFCISTVATELRSDNFTVLRTVIIVVLTFRKLLFYKMQ